MVMPVGKIGTVEVALAGSVEWNDRYQRRYIPVDPQDDRVVGTLFGLAADERIKVWRASSWKGGEGYMVFDGENRGYWRGENIRLVEIGEGFTLGPQIFVESPEPDELGMSRLGWVDYPSAGMKRRVPGVFVDGTDRLYAYFAGDWLHRHTTALTGLTSFVVKHSGTLFADPGPQDIGQILGGTLSLLYDSSASGDAFDNTPELVMWRNILFALDGDQLYEITVANTRVLRADTGVDPSIAVDYTADYPNVARITAGDVGPVWYQALYDGTTLIWQYNVESDTQEVIGTLPNRALQACTIVSAFGFVFVGAVEEDKTAADNRGFVYYQRGGQRGLAGPFRSENASGGQLSNMRPVVAGLIGDDMMVLYGRSLFAYNLTSGGVTMIHRDVTTTNVDSALTHGNQVFGTRQPLLVRYDLDTFNSEDEGELESGIIDFNYPGLEKTLLDVTVETDPLPAGTSVTVEVCGRHGTNYSALAGSHSTTDATSHTFVASTAAQTRTGRSFMIKVVLGTNSSAVSPTVRAVSARATGAAHRLEWVVAVDVGDFADQDSHSKIDELNLLAESRDVVTFLDPWQNPDDEAPDSHAVTVEEVVTPERRTAETDETYATVRLRAVSLA